MYTHKCAQQLSRATITIEVEELEQVVRAYRGAHGFQSSSVLLDAVQMGAEILVQQAPAEVDDADAPADLSEGNWGNHPDSGRFEADDVR